MQLLRVLDTTNDYEIKWIYLVDIVGNSGENRQNV